MELNHPVNNPNAECDCSQVRLLINLVVSPLNVMFLFRVSNESQKSALGLNGWSKPALEEAVMGQRETGIPQHSLSPLLSMAQAFLCPAGEMGHK